jgi:hypothetical protein
MEGDRGSDSVPISSAPVAGAVRGGGPRREPMSEDGVYPAASWAGSLAVLTYRGISTQDSTF